MCEDVPFVFKRRLLIALCVAVGMTVCAVVAGFWAPFRFDGAVSPSRLGPLPSEPVEKESVGDLTRAAQFYQQLSQVDPDPRHRQTAAMAQFQLGEYFEQTDPQRALDYFQTCAHLYEDYLHGWPWFKMGRILVAKGRDMEADNCFEHTMQIDDGRLALQAGYERGKIAVRSNRSDDAWRFFYEFLRFYPLPFGESHFLNMLGNGGKPSGRGLYVVGRSLLALGRTEEARPLLGIYIERFPNDLSGRFYAAQAGISIANPTQTGSDLFQTDPHRSNGLQLDKDGVTFSSNGRLMFDIYTAEEIPSAHLTIQARRRAEKPRLLLSVIVNAKTSREWDIPHRLHIQWKPQAPLQAGRNIVEVALQCGSPLPPSGSPIIQIQSILFLPDEIH